MKRRPEMPEREPDFDTSDFDNPDFGNSFLELPNVLLALEAGFVAHAAGQTAPPERLAGSSGGFLPGVPAYTVRLPGTEGGGMVQLLDLDTDALLATFRAGFVAALGRGVAAALATHRLAWPGARSLALLGVGEAERWLLRALAALRGLEHVQLYEPRPFLAGRFAAEIARELRAKLAKLVVVDHPDEALLDAEIVVAAPLQLTFLDPELLSPDSHVTLLVERDDLRIGELPTAWLHGARVVLDDPTLAAELVSFEVEVDTDAFGSMLAGAVPGSSAGAERTLYLALGPAWQDLAVAWSLYRGRDRGRPSPQIGS